MDVDDAKILEEAKAILKEIVDPSPDPKKEPVEIWEAWFDRMADGGQPPEIAGGAYDVGCFPLDLSPSEAVPQWIPPRRKWFLFASAYLVKSETSGIEESLDFRDGQ